MTRPANRIPTLLKLLQAEWKKHPDLRLGQLLVNAVTAIKGHVPTRHHIFNLEDDELEAWLEAGGLDREE